MPAIMTIQATFGAWVLYDQTGKLYGCSAVKRDLA